MVRKATLGKEELLSLAQEGLYTADRLKACCLLIQKNLAGEPADEDFEAVLAFVEKAVDLRKNSPIWKKQLKRFTDQYFETTYSSIYDRVSALSQKLRIAMRHRKHFIDGVKILKDMIDSVFPDGDNIPHGIVVDESFRRIVFKHLRGLIDKNREGKFDKALASRQIVARYFPSEITSEDALEHRTKAAGRLRRNPIQPKL